MEKIVYKTYVKTINQFLKSSDKGRGIDFVLYDKEFTLCRGMDTSNYINRFYTQHNSYCVIDKNYELLDWRDDYSQNIINNTKIVCEELGQKLYWDNNNKVENTWNGYNYFAKSIFNFGYRLLSLREKKMKDKNINFCDYAIRENFGLEPEEETKKEQNETDEILN